VSLFPELLRSTSDVSLNTLPFVQEKRVKEDDLMDPREELALKSEKLCLPLRIFGEGTVWLPYIPLQQLDVLMAPETKSYLVGTSNAIVSKNRGCAVDIVVDVNYSFN
jgi:hypothetical protein